MTWVIIKYLLTAGMIVAVSEIAKCSEKFGCLIAVLELI